MVNVSKLRGRMVEMSISTKELATRIGVNVCTIYRRFNEPDTFTVKEVFEIAKVLNLTQEEFDTIFFASTVASNANAIKEGQ